MDPVEIETFNSDCPHIFASGSLTQFEKIRHECKFYMSSNPTQRKIFTERKNKLCCGRNECIKKYTALLNEPI